MNSLDIVLTICLIPAIVSGIRKGFIVQVTSIIAVVLGVWLSYEFSGMLSEKISLWFHAGANISRFISFAAILVISIVLLSMLGRLIDGLVKIILLGWLNRILGVIFAILKYILIAGLLVYFFDKINGNGKIVPEAYLGDSVLYGIIEKTNAAVFPYIQGFIDAL